MSQKKKIVISLAVGLIIIFAALFLSGIITVHPTQRYIYQDCASGCNTNLNDVTDCVGFLAYLKETDQKFVSNANTIGINLTKPDKIMKTVSSSGQIFCRYYAN